MPVTNVAAAIRRGSVSKMRADTVLALLSDPEAAKGLMAQLDAKIGEAGDAQRAVEDAARAVEEDRQRLVDDRAAFEAEMTAAREELDAEKAEHAELVECARRGIGVLTGHLDDVSPGWRQPHHWTYGLENSR